MLISQGPVSTEVNFIIIFFLNVEWIRFLLIFNYVFFFLNIYVFISFKLSSGSLNIKTVMLFLLFLPLVDITVFFLNIYIYYRFSNPLLFLQRECVFLPPILDSCDGRVEGRTGNKARKRKNHVVG